MSDETKTGPRGAESHADAPAAGSNGTPAAAPRRQRAVQPQPRAAASESAPKVASAPAEEPCEDCPPAGRDWSAGLGWLMVGAALALAFIGADLASRGALSRRLGAAGWDGEQ